MRRLVALSLFLVAMPAIGQDVEVADAGVRQPAVDSHTVQPGDTLWDITARVYGDPFLWPRVWSYNPEITNPNWIYPGDIIRFYPSAEPLPSQTELIADMREIPQVEEDDEAEEYTDLEEMPDIAVVETAPVRPTGPRRVSRFVGLFVTPQELAESGTLTNSKDDKLLFAAADEVYLTLPKDQPKPAPGTRYMVYRTLGQVIHPKSKERFGYMTQVTGLATVLDQGAEVTRARLDHTVVEVERGQYVTPFLEDVWARVTPRNATRKVEGVVLAVQFDGGVVAGEQQIIFVDKGSRDGLERGHQLRVVSQGDPLTGRSANMPYATIARLVIVQANETASTCLVTDSLREVEPGAKFFTVTR